MDFLESLQAESNKMLDDAEAFHCKGGTSCVEATSEAAWQGLEQRRGSLSRLCHREMRGQDIATLVHERTSRVPVLLKGFQDKVGKE